MNPSHDLLATARPVQGRGLAARVIDRLKWVFGGRLMAEHLAFNLRSFAPHVPLGARVLDVGAWDGHLGQALARDRACDVVNADVVDKNRVPLPFIRFDGRRLPLPDSGFDRVLFAYVLHHSAHADELLAEARRVCRLGGRVLVAEDMVETRTERALVLAFHAWLLLTTGLGWKGRFRTLAGWHQRFVAAGFDVEDTVPLGRHMGRRLWPSNVLFVLRPRGG